MLLVWDFDVDHVLSANTSGVAAVIPDFDNIEETPLLDVNAVSCNCSNFPATDNVLLPPLDATPKRGNSPQPTVTERDDGNNLDDSNGNNSHDEHWFSDESEGIVCDIVSCFVFQTSCFKSMTNSNIISCVCNHAYSLIF